MWKSYSAPSANVTAGTSGGNYGAQSSSIPPLPPGKELPPGVKCVDAISQTLNTLPPPQLLDILAQMKTLATSEPQRATELLQQAPQLAAAVFQALLLMGLVSPEAIQSVVEQGVPPPTQAAIPGYPPVQIPNYSATPVVNSTPPVAAAPYAPPPAQAYPAAPAQDPDALMRAVMELSDAQINMLAEPEKQQILALRASFAAQRR
jgi:cleavage stimulation factor subunit 2